MKRKIISLICLISMFCLFAPITKSWANNSAYNRAMELFSSLEYRQAEPLFLEALRLGDLTKLEKIKVHECLAEIYAGLNQNDKAIEQYRKILELEQSYILQSDASPKLLETLAKARAQMPPPVMTEQQKSAKATKSSNKSSRTAAWICTSIVVVGIGVGSGFYAGAASEYNKFKNAGGKVQADTYRDRVRQYQAISVTGFGVGLAAGIAAIPLFIYGYKDTKTSLWYVPENGNQKIVLEIQW